MPPKWALNPLTGSIDPSPPGSNGVSQSPEGSESELSDPPISEPSLSEPLVPELDFAALDAEEGLEGEGQLEPGLLEKSLCLLRLYIENEHQNAMSQETCNDIFTPRLSENGCSLDKVFLAAPPPEDASKDGSKDGSKDAAVDPFESQHGFEGIRSCGNKTVPIYVFPSQDKNETIPVANSEPGFIPDLFMDLNAYLRGAWFTTYRSDIDCNEYIARVISPAFAQRDGPKKTTEDYVRTAVILNRAITDTFAQAQVALQDGLPLSPFRNMQIRPLFRALAILFNDSDYKKLCEAEDDEDVAMEILQVTLVSTGLDEGLTAPIEKPVDNVSEVNNVWYEKLTLGEAIEKVMRWEERERKATSTVPLPPTIALNGHKPHRYWTSLTDLPYSLTKRIRWGQGPILGPSSTWVDPDKYQYPKHLGKICVQIIRRYNLSPASMTRLWLLRERRQIHCRAWYFWYKGLSQEEREKTNGKEPSPEN